MPCRTRRSAWGEVSPHPLSFSFHLSSFAMRWTVPFPMPSDLAAFKIPMPFAGVCTFRSVALSIFGRPSFTPWATARLRPALTRWRIMVRSNSANAGENGSWSYPQELMLEVDLRFLLIANHTVPSSRYAEPR